jgi:hypothetical protein
VPFEIFNSHNSSRIEEKASNFVYMVQVRVAKNTEGCPGTLLSHLACSQIWLNLPVDYWQQKIDPPQKKKKKKNPTGRYQARHLLDYNHAVCRPHGDSPQSRNHSRGFPARQLRGSCRIRGVEIDDILDCRVFQTTTCQHSSKVQQQSLETHPKFWPSLNFFLSQTDVFSSMKKPAF